MFTVPISPLVPTPWSYYTWDLCIPFHCISQLISTALSFFSIMIHPEIFVTFGVKPNLLSRLPSLPRAVHAGLLLLRAEAEEKANYRRPTRSPRIAQSVSQKGKLNQTTPTMKGFITMYMTNTYLMLIYFERST